LFRGEVEQAAHRLGGALGCHRLQGAGRSEDHDEQPAVEDLADRRRPDRRDDHQQVHVQDLLPQRLQSGASGFPRAGAVAGQVQRPPHPRPTAGELGSDSDQEQHRGHRGPPNFRQGERLRSARRGCGGLIDNAWWGFGHRGQHRVLQETGNEGDAAVQGTGKHEEVFM
jgi:hypothetical protein